MFIAFDGLDGAGKSTQIDLLVNNLSKRGVKCQTFDMGGFGVIGKYLKALKHNKVNCSPVLREILYYFEGQLFSKYYMNCVEPQKEVVICDRWLLTYFAYGQNNGLSFEEIKGFTHEIKIPDIYFFFDIDPSLALKRIKKYRNLDQAEIGYGNKMSSDNMVNEALFIKVQNNIRKNFLDSISKLNLEVQIINGSDEKSKIENEILKGVLTCMNLEI